MYWILIGMLAVVTTGAAVDKIVVGRRRSGL